MSIVKATKAEALNAMRPLLEQYVAELKAEMREIGRRVDVMQGRLGMIDKKLTDIENKQRVASADAKGTRETIQREIARRENAS